MAQLRFHLDKQRMKQIKNSDWIALERWIYHGELQVGALHNIAAQFMLDEKGEPVPEAEAHKILGDMTLGENEEIASRLFEGIKGAAIPPASGSSS